MFERVMRALKQSNLPIATGAVAYATDDVISKVMGENVLPGVMKKSGTDVKLATTRLDLNTTYTYQPAHLKSLADYDHGSGRAHFLVESKYEDDKLGTNQHWLRMQAYTALLTGAMGQVFGNRWVWDFTRPSFLNRLTKRNWTAALDSPGVRSMGFVRALFAPLPWTELVPDDQQARRAVRVRAGPPDVAEAGPAAGERVGDVQDAGARA